MRSRVELFDQIRKDREFADPSTRALAREYGVHGRTVRQALESAVPCLGSGLRAGRRRGSVSGGS